MKVKEESHYCRLSMIENSGYIPLIFIYLESRQREAEYISYRQIRSVFPRFG